MSDTFQPQNLGASSKSSQSIFIVIPLPELDGRTMASQRSKGGGVAANHEQAAAPSGTTHLLSRRKKEQAES